MRSLLVGHQPGSVVAIDTFGSRGRTRPIGSNPAWDGQVYDWQHGNLNPRQIGQPGSSEPIILRNPVLEWLREAERRALEVTTPTWRRELPACAKGITPKRLSDDGFQAVWRMQWFRRIDPLEPIKRLGDFGPALEPRLDYLRARRVGLDFVEAGQAVECHGIYYHVIRNGGTARFRTAQEEILRTCGRLDRPLGALDKSQSQLLRWMGLSKAISYDQVVAMCPAHPKRQEAVLRQLLGAELVRPLEVPVGKGRVVLFGLTEHGVETMELNFPGSMERGIKIGEVPTGHLVHTLAQVDALLWLAQETRMLGGEVLDVWLEDGLRRRDPDLAAYPDFEVRLVNPHGVEVRVPVEVMGVGRGSYGPGRLVQRAGSFGPGNVVFDPGGRRSDATVSVGR